MGVEERYVQGCQCTIVMFVLVEPSQSVHGEVSFAYGVSLVRFGRLAEDCPLV